MEMFRVPVQSVSVVRIVRVLFAAVALPIVTSQFTGSLCEPALVPGLVGCATASATAALCLANGCCFDTTNNCRALDPALLCTLLGDLPRVPCPTGGNQAMGACTGNGCCFNNNFPPICFQSTPLPVLDMCQSILLSLRISCGDSLDMTACVSRHCCYDGVKFGNSPKCFWPCPRGDPDCAATTNRIDCGFHHITEEECQERLCIFDDTISGIPFCSEGPAKGTVPAPGVCTAIALGQRDDCGYAGISQVTCERRGCCYEEAASGPWCYKPVTRTIAGDCVVGTSTRFDCGEPGISQRRCEARSCCWDESVGDNGQPWCYDMIVTTTPTPATCNGIVAASRVDCGFPGIGQNQCEGRGCCYRTTPPNAIWCFEGMPRDPTCNLPMDQNTLVDCGFPGINAVQCRARHCCFDTTVHSGNPECSVPR